MLEVDGINVFYGEAQALWDISLKVNEGEIVTLIGSNGAGKSTTHQDDLRPADPGSRGRSVSTAAASAGWPRIRSSKPASPKSRKAGGCGPN